MKSQSLRLPIAAIAGVALAIASAFAQNIPTAMADAAPATPNPSPPPAAEAAAQPQGEAPQNQPGPTLGKEQLDQLVAPVALYPDPLLSQILMAATYPLEVVEAARWMATPATKALRGNALINAVKAQNWDPSVMALIPFPRVLELMNSKIEWTRQLGEAFVAQQSDVMDAVQRLRHLAQAAGHLKTTQQCRCLVATKGDEITITTVENEPVAVPIYNSRVVYGMWPYPDYPPFWFPLPVGFDFEPGIFIGFGPPIDVAFFGPLWGWSWIDWGSGRIGLDPVRVAAFAPGRTGFAGTVWAHDPARGAHAGLHAAAFAGAAAARFGGTGAARFAGAGTGRFAGAGTGRLAGTRFGGAAPIHNVAAFHGGAAFRSGALRGSPAIARGGAAPAFHGGGGVHTAAIRGGGAAVHAGGGGGGHPAIAAAAARGGGGAPHGGGGGGGGHPGGGGGNHH